MSTLNVDKVDPSTGTDLEIGSSGDTITIPSGATIVNSGTATGFGLTGVTTGSGNVTITNGDLILGTSGKGIDFSATSGTGTSELLDDYEEGICVVTFATQGGSITINTGYDTMQYTKIGRQVHLQGHIQVTSVSSPSGYVRITALPFTAGAADSEYSGTASSGVYHGDLNATSGTNVLWYIPPSGTNMIFYDQNTTAPEDMADHFKAGSYLIISAIYEI